MIIRENCVFHRGVCVGFSGALVFSLVILLSTAIPTHSQTGEKISVGILPFDDASGAGIPDANLAVLSRQLRAQLIRSGRLTPRMLALAPGTALPLEPEQAAELGRAAKADLVAAPTVVKAESKPFQKGATSGRSVFGIQLGGARAAGVTAEVKLQVDLIRTSDGQSIDSFAVESKKTSTSVSADVGGVSTNLGAADFGAANFHSSPLGQALNEALTKVASEMEVRSVKAASRPASSSTLGPRQEVTITGAGTAFDGSYSTSGVPRDINLSIPPFSADQIHTAAGRTTTGKIYGTDKAFRIESEQKGRKSIVIMRLDRKVMWVLMPDQRMYMEMGSPDTAELASLQEGAKTQRESLGTEQVGAYHCDKARVRVNYEGHEYTSIEWAAKELNGFVVKREDETGQWSTEYQNVRLGPQDPSLFEIPPGYRKMSMGGMQAPRP